MRKVYAEGDGPGEEKMKSTSSCDELEQMQNVPQHIFEMESILEKATQMMEDLEEKIEEYKAFQSEIRKLEAYYTSPQWKADYAADEAGQYPDQLKRGVLSEDGIWNLLERNNELVGKIGV